MGTYVVQPHFKMDIKAVAILFVTVFQTCHTSKSHQDEVAILVTGGRGDYYLDDIYSSSEVLLSNGTFFCSIAEMTQTKLGHTQSGLTACGGYSGNDNENEGKSCIKFQSGSWSTLTENLTYKYFGHGSWMNPDGNILLIGADGGDSIYDKTEIVYQNGTSIQSFDLKYDTV